MSTPSSTPINPQDPGLGPVILGVTWTLTSLCVIVIAARFYVRPRTSRLPGLDDWFMLAAGVLQLAFQGCVTKAYYLGLGKHDPSLTYDEMVMILKWSWISATPAILVSITARISASILLVRIFGSRAWFKWFMIIFTGLQTAIASLLVIVVWVQVSPIEGLWDPLIPARRWDTRIQLDLAYLTQALFSFADLTYVLFPVIIIWSLHMPLRRRIGLCLLMAMSLVTMVASIMKTVTSQGSNATNAQYNASKAVLWSALEQSFVIIMSCIPSLRAAMKLDFLSKLRSIGSSLSGILSRTGASGEGTSKSTSNDRSFGNHAAYYDLEMNTDKLGHLGSPDHQGSQEALGARSITCFKEGSTSSQRTGNQIRRTDHFAISYEGQAVANEST
ncbi:hypothetical protein DL771_009694 [Monosporascus sp. 5C6A]|nr:hypothetical protein DL771_009694 [Monosporascus sp. 5C6A]